MPRTSGDGSFGVLSVLFGAAVSSARGASNMLNVLMPKWVSYKGSTQRFSASHKNEATKVALEKRSRCQKKRMRNPWIKNKKTRPIPPFSGKYEPTEKNS